MSLTISPAVSYGKFNSYNALNCKKQAVSFSKSQEPIPGHVDMNKETLQMAEKTAELLKTKTKEAHNKICTFFEDMENNGMKLSYDSNLVSIKVKNPFVELLSADKKTGFALDDQEFYASGKIVNSYRVFDKETDSVVFIKNDQIKLPRAEREKLMNQCGEKDFDANAHVQRCLTKINQNQ